MSVLSRGTGRHAVLLVWRDTQNPEGGGSERYVEEVARHLSGEGWKVTVCCADYPGAIRDETVDGVHFRRRGGRLTVYLFGLLYLLSRAGRSADVVVDVQNGVPFFSPLVRRKPIVALVHHVHHEQWQIIYPGLAGHIGWWLESRVAPRLYRRRQYVTVSQSSKADLVGLGVAAERIAVVPNGLEFPDPAGFEPANVDPTVCVLGRLVPHKQVEHVIDAAAQLRAHYPTLRVEIVGDGWWRGHLAEHAVRTGVTDLVSFHGMVPDGERDAILDRSWLLVLPSVKEGWGLVIMEAAARGLPAVAYRTAGGVTESIVDGETGWLVDDFDGLVKRIDELLGDPALCALMGAAGQRRAAEFDWGKTGEKFEKVLTDALR
jgi:glycosyltransferase involved in cell wall biosynthesis